MTDEGEIMEEMYRILIVDDEEETRNALVETLKRNKRFKSEVVSVGTGEDALYEMERKDFDLVLSDYIMPGMNGVELLAKVKERFPNTVRLLITAYGDLIIAKDAEQRTEINNYIEKPWNKDELLSTLHVALKRRAEMEMFRKGRMESAAECLDAVRRVQKGLMQKVGTLTLLSGSRKMAFEFDSAHEFNKFSYEICEIKNITIEDVHIFENRGVILITVHPITSHSRLGGRPGNKG